MKVAPAIKMGWLERRLALPLLSYLLEGLFSREGNVILRRLM